MHADPRTLARASLFTLLGLVSLVPAFDRRRLHPAALGELTAPQGVEATLMGFAGSRIGF